MRTTRRKSLWRRLRHWARRHDRALDRTVTVMVLGLAVGVALLVLVALKR